MKAFVLTALTNFRVVGNPEGIRLGPGKPSFTGCAFWET
jgi:hypothetical protein